MSDSNASGSGPGVQEFKIHACGNLYKGVEHFIGKFTAGVDVFKKGSTGWKLRRQVEDPNVRRRGPQAKKPRTMPLDLLNSGGHITHTAQPEVSMANSSTAGSMRHFVLVKEGGHFSALPIRDWYSFRPNVRSQKVMSLEEAEKKMNAQGTTVQLGANSRLAALVAKAEIEGDQGEEADDEGEAPDSDEERETLRAAKMKAIATEAQNGGTSGALQTPADAVQVDQGEKGEDWEHEDERADDDLEQGDEDGSDQDTPEVPKKSIVEPDSDGDDKNLTEEGQEINRILKSTHLSSPSASDGDEPSSRMDDDDDDDLDLDDMASKLMPKAKGRDRSPSVAKSLDSGSQKSQKSSQKGSQASKRATPPPSGLGAGKRKAPTPPIQEAAKKARPETKPEAKKATTASSTQSDVTSGPPSAKEIADCLRALGPVTASELTTRFKRRLPTQADRKQFTANVKKVSRLEERPPGSGNKFVVLK